MNDDEERKPLPWQDHRAVRDYWLKLGLPKRSANGLIHAGYATIEDLKTASDHDIAILPNVGPEGKAVIYRLIERKPPGTLRTAAERRSAFESEWRARAGDERFDRLIDEIVKVAWADLEKVNVHAAQALWNIARQRRLAAK